MGIFANLLLPYMHNMDNLSFQTVETMRFSKIYSGNKILAKNL